MEPIDKTSEEAPTIENEAREMGWTDKDAFKGDPEKWVDAATFVDRGRNLLPLVKKQNKELRDALAKRDADLEEVKKSAKEFQSFTKAALEREFNERLAALEEKQAKAIEEGDGKAAVAVQREISALEKQKPEEKQEEKKETPQITPEFRDWVDENKWYEKNEEMRDEADGIGLALAKRGYKGKELFQKVRERIERLYPEEFGERPSPQRGGKVSEKPAAKSFDNLPQEAKAACDKFIKNGWVKNREQYVKEYDWS